MSQTIILDPTVIKSLALTPERMGVAGLEPGATVSVVVEPGKVTFKSSPIEEKRAILDGLIGLYASTPGLVEELQEERPQQKW